MKRSVSFLFLLMLAAAASPPLWGSETGDVPILKALKKAFESEHEWTIPPDQSQASRTMTALSGELWDFHTVSTLSVKAERVNASGGSARLRWLVNSRVGGLYLGPAVSLPLSGVATPTIHFTAESGELTPVGHQRPWDALAASEVTSLELRAEYTAGLSKNGTSGSLEISLNDVQLITSTQPSAKPEVLDLRLQLTSNGNRNGYFLSFRLNPLPNDPYAASGEGDVRVKFSGGKQALAFLDQESIEIKDGAAVRLAAIGLPVWRAYLSEWPASGSFDIVSGKNKWSIPCAALKNTLLTPQKKDDAKPPAASISSLRNESPRPPRPLTRLRWETPLEASAPPLDANWTGAASYWSLDRSGHWLPFSQTEMMKQYALPANATPADVVSKKVWRPVPFWNESWGGYAGSRRPDYALALSMEAMLESAARDGESRPLILFDGASLERQGVFNWASHPLRGKLAGPGEIFRTEEGFDFCARWMRYCLARYAQSPAVSSLLITSDLNAPGASEFHARLAPLLKDWRTGVAAEKPLIAFHPLAQPAQVVRAFGTFEPDNRDQDASWRVDQRVMRALGRIINGGGLGGGRCYEVSAMEPSSTAVALQNTYNLEFSDYRKPADDNFFESNALMFEVWTPPDAPHDLRVGVHLRDRNGNWFQTLLPGMIRPGDWTTFALDLTAANAHGLTAVNHRTTWTDYSRQRIQEIGLHVYSTHPSFSVSSGRIQNLTARFDNIRGVVFPQTAPEAKTEITVFDPYPPAPNAASVKLATRGSLVEYHLKVNKAFANPFDARDCDLVALVTAPSGKTSRVPAFFNQLYERREETPGGDEIVEPIGGEFFTVRYRAQEIGPHAVTIELREHGHFDVQKRWIPDDRFSPEGEAQAGVSPRWPHTQYPLHGLHDDGKRAVEKINFVPGPVTAMLDLGPRAFTVIEGDKSFHGFVRAAKDKRHFECDDGSFFYPMGPCLRSPSDSRIPYRSATDKFAPATIDKLGKRGTYQYDVYFDAFGKAGITWTRVWMCSWWGALEWRRDWPGYQGLGRYNLANAWRMDYVLALAEKNGIRLNLAITNHGQFTLDIDSEWKNNPYNAKLGGPLTAPCEIFTRAEAKINHQNKLRYVAARYGHSPSVLAFALFSELEFTEEYDRSINFDRGPDYPAPNIESWHAEMAAYLKNIDPNKHLISTHYSHPYRGEGTLMVPEIDIATSNAYSAFEELQPMRGVDDASSALHDFWMGNQDGTLKGFHIFDKPALVEEQGRHWLGIEGRREHNTKAQLDADLHAGLWGSVVVPLSGATGYWWWLHIHFDNRYFEYRALANFVQGEDFRPIGDEATFKPVFRSIPNSPLLGRALKSDRRMYVWIYHQRTPSGDANIEPVSNTLMNVGGLRPGKYSVEFWNTYTGEKISSQTVEYIKEKSNMEVKLPTVTRDIAMKIKPIP